MNRADKIEATISTYNKWHNTIAEETTAVQRSDIKYGGAFQPVGAWFRSKEVLSSSFAMLSLVTRGMEPWARLRERGSWWIMGDVLIGHDSGPREQWYVIDLTEDDAPPRVPTLAEAVIAGLLQWDKDLEARGLGKTT